MTTSQISMLGMFKSVHQLCTDEHKLIENIPPFVSGVNTLGQLITAIECLNEIMALRPGDTARDRSAVRLTLCRITSSNLSAALAYATHVQDKELEETIAAFLAVLKKIPHDNLADETRLVFKIIQPLAPRLAVYGLTSGIVSAWNFVINTYSPNFKSPKEAMDHRKKLGQCHIQLFKAGAILCENFLDPLAESLEKKKPAFRNEYVNRRKSIPPELQACAGIRGRISIRQDSPQNALEALTGATITLVETGVIVVSDEEGVFNFRTVKKGTYTLRAEKEGFFTKTSSKIEHSDRQVSVVDFELSQIEVLQD